jgi:hypothetical protein
MNDYSEEARRKLVSNQKANGPLGREQLESAHGQLWTTKELIRDFAVQGFMAPFVIVQRKADSAIGTLSFQHDPRFYWGFEKDLE